MKKLFLILFVALTAAACKSDVNNTGTVENSNETSVTVPREEEASLTSILWLDSTFRDMGNMKKGEILEISFRFKNTGNKPLVIANVTAGCGCTVPEKPAEPYPPGKEGVIKAKFDSNSQQPGEHRKNVTVTANTSPESIHVLTFRVDVNK